MSKKNKGKNSSGKKKSNKGLVTVLVIVLLLLVALVAAMLLGLKERESAPVETEAAVIETQMQETEAAVQTEAPTTAPAAPAPIELLNLDLGYGLIITDIGGYTGMYMEDGTDEIVSGVLMLVLENTGEQDIQYAEITMDFEDQQAQFSLTTLPVGSRVVLLEKNRIQWEDSMDDGYVLPVMKNVAPFQVPMSTMEDKLQIGIMDGAINVSNISGEDINGIISVYYKNASADIYYGGITYRIQIKDGLKAGEIRQVMTNHASDTGSQIMFVTIGA